MMSAVRRLVAILLFAAFALPLAVPAFALGQNADAGLPACCRRTGVHHCGMSLAEKQAMATADPAKDWEAPRWQAKLERCPFLPATLAAAHANPLAAPAIEAGFAGSSSHPSGIAQTESKRRIARDRSRQKRGPPVVSLA